MEFDNDELFVQEFPQYDYDNQQFINILRSKIQSKIKWSQNKLKDEQIDEADIFEYDAQMNKSLQNLFSYDDQLNNYDNYPENNNSEQVQIEQNKNISLKINQRIQGVNFDQMKIPKNKIFNLQRQIINKNHFNFDVINQYNEKNLQETQNKYLESQFLYKVDFQNDNKIENLRKRLEQNLQIIYNDQLSQYKNTDEKNQQQSNDKQLVQQIKIIQGNGEYQQVEQKIKIIENNNQDPFITINGFGKSIELDGKQLIMMQQDNDSSPQYKPQNFDQINSIQKSQLQQQKQDETKFNNDVSQDYKRYVSKYQKIDIHKSKSQSKSSIIIENTNQQDNFVQNNQNLTKTILKKSNENDVIKSNYNSDNKLDDEQQQEQIKESSKKYLNNKNQDNLEKIQSQDLYQKYQKRNTPNKIGQASGNSQFAIDLQNKFEKISQQQLNKDLVNISDIEDQQLITKNHSQQNKETKIHLKIDEYTQTEQLSNEFDGFHQKLLNNKNKFINLSDNVQQYSPLNIQKQRYFLNNMINSPSQNLDSPKTQVQIIQSKYEQIDSNQIHIYEPRSPKFRHMKKITPFQHSNMQVSLENNQQNEETPKIQQKYRQKSPSFNYTFKDQNSSTMDKYQKIYKQKEWQKQYDLTFKQSQQIQLIEKKIYDSVKKKKIINTPIKALKYIDQNLNSKQRSKSQITSHQKYLERSNQIHSPEPFELQQRLLNRYK